jgi:hypothetical protein
MTDPDLIEKKLAQIETYIADLRRLARPELDRDVREERFVEHTLQLAIQAALDVASHIVSDERLGELAPIGNFSLYWPPRVSGSIAVTAALGNMAGFETSWSMATIRSIRHRSRYPAHHLDDLLQFAAAIRAVMAADDRR